MDDKKGLSELRTSLELILLVVGLIAGVLLIYVFFVDLGKYPEENVISLTKAKEVVASLSTFNEQAVIVYVLVALSLFFTIRFFIVFRKVISENGSS